MAGEVWTSCAELGRDDQFSELLQATVWDSRRERFCTGHKKAVTQVKNIILKAYLSTNTHTVYIH